MNKTPVKVIPLYESCHYRVKDTPEAIDLMRSGYHLSLHGYMYSISDKGALLIDGCLCNPPMMPTSFEDAMLFKLM